MVATARFTETLLNEPQRYVLKRLGRADPYAYRPDEGKEADTAAELVQMGFAGREDDLFYLTDAGRSQLRSNLST